MGISNLSDKDKNNKEDPITYMKMSEESMRLRKYEDAIKEIDKAICLSKDDMELAKDEKLRILSILVERASKHLSFNEIDEAIILLNIYLKSDKYIRNTEQYHRGIEEALKIMVYDIVSLKNDKEIKKSLEWIYKTKNIHSPDKDILSELNKFIDKYIMRTIKTSKNEDNALEQLSVLSKYSSDINRKEIEDYKMTIYMNFENYQQIISYIEDKFLVLVNSNEGRKKLDEYRDFIYKSREERYIYKLKEVFIKMNIPEYLVKMSFSNNFNFKYLEKEFKNYLDINNLEKANSLFLCIEDYFDFLDIDKDIFMKYCYETEKYFLGMEYFNHHINENPDDLKLIEKTMFFIKRLRGVEKSKEFLRNKIKKASLASDIEQQCSLINIYSLFCYKYDSNCDIKEELKDIKDIDTIVDFILLVYKEKGSICLEYISKKLIDNIGKLEEDKVLNIIKILREYFNTSSDDEMILAQMAYDIGEFEKSLLILSNIDNNSIESNGKNLICELQIYNYISLREYDKALEKCQKLIKDLGLCHDEAMISLYVDTIIESREYERGIAYLKKYNNINNLNLGNDKKSWIESYIAKLYLKKGNILLFSSNWLKSQYRKTRNKNTKDAIKGLLILFFIIAFIFQYRMYATGAWKPISAKAHFNLENIVLEKGETFRIKGKVKVKKFPFYAKLSKENIVIENLSIVKLKDGYITGLEEGQTDIVLYMDETEVGRSTIKVADIKLVNYTISYEGEPEFVGDKVTPHFEYEFEDDRTKKYDIAMKSSNDDIIKVENGDIIAVGVGDATVTVIIAGITKYLPFNIRDEIEDEEVPEPEDNVIEEDPDNEEVETEEYENYYIGRKDEYLNRFVELENEEAYWQEEYTDETEVKRREYEAWDNTLNEIWGVLEHELPSHEIENLRTEQSQWMYDKEAQATINSNQYSDQYNKDMVYYDTLIEFTKQRSNELVYKYME